MMMDRPIEILLVEDNPGDVRLTLTALRDARILNAVNVVEDGESALAFLRRQGEYRRAPRPDVIFLDLNLPRLSGHDVLAALKADPALRSIPVVVVSSSDAERDISQAYDEQISCYIVKPLDADQYFNAIRAVKELFLHVVELPPTDPSTVNAA